MPEVGYAVLRTSEELTAFVPAWKALWARDPEATPFQSPEWLLPWWRVFGQPDLRAVTIAHAGKLVGFVPCYVYPDSNAHERQLLLLGVGTTDYLNGVFSPACSVECIRGALELLYAEGGWDTFCALQLRPGSKLVRALEGYPSAVGFVSESCSRMPAVPLAELPQKIRRNAMYYRNRALRRGTLELRTADSSNLEEAFTALVRLHTGRWQTRGEPGVLADPKVLAWHRDALPLLALAGHLRLCTLRLNSEIIGVLYSLIDSPGSVTRTQYFYLTAYSEAHAELRPGTLLLALAIEAAALEGVRTIDMLRGEESYKQLWHLDRVPTCGFALRRADGPSQNEIGEEQRS